jgi:hypothetical protein
MRILERRMDKHANWMQEVRAQMLEAEITRSAYNIRVTTSEQRCAQLGKDLGNAYRHITELLGSRIEVEGIAAHNDALIMYLNDVRRMDENNDENFIDNREALTSVLNICDKTRNQKMLLDELVAEADTKYQLCNGIWETGERLIQFNEQLRMLWIGIPGHIKEQIYSPFGGSEGPRALASSVYRATARHRADDDGHEHGSAPPTHPSSASQAIQANVGEIVFTIQAILQKLEVESEWRAAHGHKTEPASLGGDANELLIALRSLAGIAAPPQETKVSRSASDSLSDSDSGDLFDDEKTRSILNPHDSSRRPLSPNSRGAPARPVGMAVGEKMERSCSDGGSDGGDSVDSGDA